MEVSAPGHHETLAGIGIACPSSPETCYTCSWQRFFCGCSNTGQDQGHTSMCQWTSSVRPSRTALQGSATQQPWRNPMTRPATRRKLWCMTNGALQVCLLTCPYSSRYSLHISFTHSIHLPSHPPCTPPTQQPSHLAHCRPTQQLTHPPNHTPTQSPTHLSSLPTHLAHPPPTQPTTHPPRSSCLRVATNYTVQQILLPHLACSDMMTTPNIACDQDWQCLQNKLWQYRRTSVEGADAAGSHSGAAQLLPLHLQSCAGNA